MQQPFHISYFQTTAWSQATIPNNLIVDFLQETNWKIFLKKEFDLKDMKIHSCPHVTLWAAPTYILQVHLEKIHSHRSKKTPPGVKSSNLKETVYIKIWFISDVQQIIEVPGTTSYHEIKLLEHNVEANQVHIWRIDYKMFHSSKILCKLFKSMAKINQTENCKHLIWPDFTWMRKKLKP